MRPTNQETPKVAWQEAKVVKKTTTGQTAEPQVSLDLIDEAKNSDKPIMIYFYFTKNGQSIKACKALENWAMASPGVTKESVKFFNVKVDLSKVEKSELKTLAKSYKFKTVPTVVFLSYSGKYLYKFSGNSTPQNFVVAMQRVLAANKILLKKEKQKAKS